MMPQYRDRRHTWILDQFGMLNDASCLLSVDTVAGILPCLAVLRPNSILLRRDWPSPLMCLYIYTVYLRHKCGTADLSPDRAYSVSDDASVTRNDVHNPPPSKPTQMLAMINKPFPEH